MERKLEAPSNESLSELSELGRQLEVERGLVEELGRAIAESQAKITKLSETTIPELMNAVGLEEIKLKSGTKVTLKPVYSASLPVKDLQKRQEALQWLKDNDQGALIKAAISMKYGMGEEETAKMVMLLLSDHNVDFEAKEDVHASTLKAFVKERYEKGESFPEELFGAFTKTVAQIKTK